MAAGSGARRAAGSVARTRHGSRTGRSAAGSPLRGLQVWGEGRLRTIAQAARGRQTDGLRAGSAARLEGLRAFCLVRLGPRARAQGERRHVGLPSARGDRARTATSPPGRNNNNSGSSCLCLVVSASSTSLRSLAGSRIRAAMVRNRWLVMDLAGWAGYRNQETADSQAAMVALPLALATLNSSPEATLGPP